MSMTGPGDTRRRRRWTRQRGETKVHVDGRHWHDKRPWSTSRGMRTRGNNQPENKRGATRSRKLVLPTTKSDENGYTTISHKGTHKLVSADAMASITINFVGAQQTTVAADGVAMAKE